MKHLYKFLLLLGWVMQALPGHAQDNVLPEKVLTEEGFFAILKKYHPVLQQANIGVDQAKAALLASRGGFDPTISLSNDQKTFDGKNYYRYINPELKIPTWYGIDIKAGTESNNGLFADSELTIGQSSYLGVSVPLAKNLLMDKRRAALQQAKIMVGFSEEERRKLINDLVFDAGSSYWNWVRAWQNKQVLDELVTVNRTRYKLILIGYRQGDRPALDTTEALAQLQQFEFMQSDAEVSLKVSALELSNFLWQEQNKFYQLDSITRPDSSWMLGTAALALPSYADLLAKASTAHPELKMYEQKLKSLRIDRKLKFQELLPSINLSANLLNRGYNVFSKIGGNFYENNNKFGLSLGLPLRLSEGRGSYRLAGLKIQETNLEFDRKRQQIINKLNAYFSELNGLIKQVGIYEEANQNYERLVRGENIRFQAGEGTLFLLNARENKLLEARQKLIELKTKLYKSVIAVQWAAGELGR